MVSILPGIESVATGNSDSSKIIFWRLSLYILLSSIDPGQFGFIPGSSTTFALISMLHYWLCATDGNGATVRTALLDYRKAFDLVDHHLLIAKLFSLGVKPTIVN